VSYNCDVGIYSSGNSSTIRGNTVSNNDGGIISLGSSSTINGNTVRDNEYIGIYSDGSSSTISGNRITGNIDTGLYLDSFSEGTVFNNYFANTNNVDGDSTAISLHTWNQAPASGTNIVGGPNVAGNYWSNPTGTGWSDTHATDSRGYTNDPYEIATGSGVYDNAPLVRVPSPTPDNSSPDRYSSSPLDTGSSGPQIWFIIVSASLSDGAVPRTTTTLTLILENQGTTVLPAETRIILVPANDAARMLGELEAVNTKGQYVITSSLTLPEEPGEYTYLFTPRQIIRDPATGEEIRIPAGAAVKVTVVIGEDGAVRVISP